MMAPQEIRKKRKEPTLKFSEPKPSQDLNEIDLEEMKTFHARHGEAGDRGAYSGGIDV